MIEVVLLLGGDLDCACDLGQVVRVHTYDVDATILLAWHEEAIRNDDGAFTEDVMGDDRDVVGPLEAWSVELDRLKRADIAILHSLLHAWHHVNMAGAHGGESRNKEEVLTAIELSQVDKGSILDTKLVVRSERKVSSS